MADLPGTKVSAPVVPFTTDDIYPTHDSKYGKGGWKEMATIADRDAIPIDRRSQGMVVHVVNDPLPLNNVPWILQADLVSYVALATGGGGGTTIIDGFLFSATNSTLNPMVAGQVVCLVTNQLKLADKVDPARFRAVGLVNDSVIPPGGSGNIKTGGVLTLNDWTPVIGSTLLMAGVAYYLSSDGTMTPTPTYNLGDYIVCIGQASTDGKTLAVDPEVLMAV